MTKQMWTTICDRFSGYTVVSPSEGEIVAKKFYEMGYQTAVVTYTTNLLQMIPLKMQPMQDLMRCNPLY